MAYTYADFERAANEAGMNGTFNDNDLSLAQRFPEYGLSLISLRRDLNNATTKEQKLLATEAENQLRKNYGSFNVTGNTYDGSGMPGTKGTQSSATGLNTPAFSTDAAGMNGLNRVPGSAAGAGTATTDSGAAGTQGGAASAAATGKKLTEITGSGGKKYLVDSAQLPGTGLTGVAKAAAESAETDEGPDPEEFKTDYERVLDRVVNGQEPFSFDPFTDERISAYKKAYNREGDRAAANALATAAAATGGRPSSWATTAAQEANNYYAAKLADIIPTIRTDARSEYDKDFSQLTQQLNAAYQQERDQINDEQKDLENAITIYQYTKKIVEPLKSMLEALNKK